MHYNCSVHEALRQMHELMCVIEELLVFVSPLPFPPQDPESHTHFIFTPSQLFSHTQLNDLKTISLYPAIRFRNS